MLELISDKKGNVKAFKVWNISTEKQSKAIRVLTELKIINLKKKRSVNKYFNVKNERKPKKELFYPLASIEN